MIRVHQGWHRPGPKRQIEAGAVDVWHIDLSHPDLQTVAWHEYLDRYHARWLSSRYARPGAAVVKNYSAWRVILKALLPFYTNEALPLQWLLYSSRGKPFVNSNPHLNFSISHSAEQLLIAVSADQSVGDLGVDIECIRPIQAIDQLARNSLHPIEIESGGTSYFFNYWSAKESLVKALGEGWSRLDPKEVVLQPVASAEGDFAVLGIHSVSEYANLYCHALSPLDDAVAYLCTSQGQMALQCKKVDPQWILNELNIS